jgi:hypothetical protein
LEGVAIVRPGDPYIEWAAKAFGEPEASVKMELADVEPGVYLLPESAAAGVHDPKVLKG